MKERQKKENRKGNKEIRNQEPGVRWSVRRSSWVRSCLFCRLPRGWFRVNWATHGNTFFVFFPFSLSLPLWSAHMTVTDKIHSLLSFFIYVSFVLSSSLSVCLPQTYPVAFCLHWLSFHQQGLTIWSFACSLQRLQWTASTTEIC